MTSKVIRGNFPASETIAQVNNIVDLKALDERDIASVQVLGYYAAGDIEARTFIWSGTSVATDNGGTVIIPTYAGFSGNGRWLFEASEVNVKMFGAKGDGVTDDSNSIQIAIDSSPGIIVGTGDNSLINIDIDLASNQTMFNMNFVGDANVVELTRFVENTYNNTLISCQFDHTTKLNGLAYHLNKASCLDNIVALSRIKSNGYGLLIDSSSDNNNGFINIGNIIFSETRDAIEYNSPDFNTDNYVTVGNILETGTSGPGGAGFAYGHAATRYYVFADSVIKFSRQEAIHIEDEQRGGIISGISVKGTNDHGIYIQPPIPAQGQGAADPVITQGLHITHTGTKVGFNGFNMAFTGDPYIAALGSNHIMKNFDAGYFLSGTDGYSMLDNSIAINCNIGIYVKSRHTHNGTIHVQNCPILAKGGRNSRIGKVISDSTPTTILEVESGFPGSYMSGFLFPKDLTHTGSGLESFDLFDLEDLTHGKLSLQFRNGSGFFYVADIAWDGTTLTTTNKEVRASGAVTAVNIIKNGTQLAVEITSAAPITTSEIIVDFDGRYMKFTL